MLSLWFRHKITSCLGIVVFLISLLNYPTFIDPTSRWKWLSTRDSILPLCSDELWCKGKLKQYWVTDRLATSNLAKRRSFALRSTFIFIRKILSVWMFSLEVEREETWGGGGGQPLHQQLFSIHFADDQLQLLLLEIFVYVATVSRKSHFQLFGFVFLGQISTKLMYTNNGFQLIQQIFYLYSRHRVVVMMGSTSRNFKSACKVQR